MAPAEERIGKMELILERLTVVQEIQSDQMKELLKNGKVMISIADSVGEHTVNILDLYNKINGISERIHLQKEELNNSITEARSSMAKASYGRFILAITISVGITWRLFEVTQAHIDAIYETKTSVLERVSKIEIETKHMHQHLIKGK